MLERALDNGNGAGHLAPMPTAAETLIARLQADCTAAETAERAVRANVDCQLKDAEIARAFAWRRLSALPDMARIAASEPAREIAVERQLCALFREIGWIEDGLADLGDGAKPLIDWLRPIAGHCMPRLIRRRKTNPRPARPSPTRSPRFAPSRPGTNRSAASLSSRCSTATWRRRRWSSSRMKSDFEQWLAAQFADTGPFTAFIVLVRIAGEEVTALKSSYAHLIGDDMPWAAMRRLLDSSGAWHGVAFFVGLAHDGGPLPDTDAAQKLKQVEADVTADPLSLNRGLFFDRQGRHMRIDEVANG